MQDASRPMREPGKDYRIHLPEYACPPTFCLTGKGARYDECPHEWERSETDTDIYWSCRRCNSTAACEAYD